MFESVIKWSGSKRSQAEEIIKHFPNDIYDKHIYIKSGNSSFKRVIGKSNNSIVYESLYLK